MDIPSISLHNRTSDRGELQQALKETEFNYVDWNSQSGYLNDFSKRLEQNTHSKISSQLNDIVGTHTTGSNVIKVDYLDSNSQTLNKEDYQQSSGLGVISLTSSDENILDQSDVITDRKSIKY